MNKYLLSLFVFLASTTAMGAAAPQVIPNDQLQLGKTSAADKTIIFNKAAGAANPKIKWNNTTSKIQFSNDGTNYKNIGAGSGGGGISLITDVNPGFEEGTSQWTASGGSFTATSSSPAYELQSGVFNASANAQTLSSTAVSIPVGLQGKSCVGSIWYNTTEATNKYKLQVYDGTTVLSEITLEPTLTWEKSSAYVSFLCPSSGTILLRVIAAGDAADIFLDQAFLGENALSQISQATLVGTLRYAGTANCNWLTTGTGTFSADSDCPTPTVTGELAAPGTKIPGFTTTKGLAPGHYLIMASGNFYCERSAAQDCSASFSISDGTTRTNKVAFYSFANSSAGHSDSIGTIVGSFDYTSAQTVKTFQMYVELVNTQANVTATANYDLEFKVYRFPTSSETAYRVDANASYYSGYHDNTCSWARTNTAFGDFTADASCSLVTRVSNGISAAATGSVLPSIVLTLPRVGTYYVCAHQSGYLGVGGNGSIRLWDGTNSLGDVELNTGNREGKPLCGILNATSLSATVTLQAKSPATSVNMNAVSSDAVINWTVFPLTGSFPNPILTGARDQVTVYSGNGVGATNTTVRRFITTGYSLGSCVTFTDSASLGSYFTINCNGVYSVNYGDGGTGSDCLMAITQNGSALTTTPSAITYAQGLRAYVYARNGENETVSWTGNFSSGDIVRAQGACNLGTSPMVNFTVTRVN